MTCRGLVVEQGVGMGQGGHGPDGLVEGRLVGVLVHGGDRSARRGGRRRPVGRGGVRATRENGTGERTDGDFPPVPGWVTWSRSTGPRSSALAATS